MLLQRKSDHVFTHLSGISLEIKHLLFYFFSFFFVHLVSSIYTVLIIRLEKSVGFGKSWSSTEILESDAIASTMRPAVLAEFCDLSAILTQLWGVVWHCG